MAKYPSSESNKDAGTPSKSKVGYCKGYALFVLYELCLTLFYKSFTRSLIQPH
ncbi:hypothetical protein VCHA39O220_240031 [Vibrio chagasii]|nr:hypothetical protein VCHA39O220_240031 [Vibrio chagasii]